MISLLAYRPGMPAAFDVVTTIQSLVIVILGIGIGMSMSVGCRNRPRRFLAGLPLGTSVALLHYLGQFGYRIPSSIVWDLPLAIGSCLTGLMLFGLGIMV